MKKQLLFLLLMPIMAFAQIADSAWIVNNYTKTDYQIPMRDGVKLFTTVYAPKNSTEKHPIILTRTPYSCAPYGENVFGKFRQGQENIFLKNNIFMSFKM